jgi:transcriptional regulator with XRE-family HTH domain
VSSAAELKRVLGAIGRRLAEARTVAGLTQEAAAARAGIDYKRWQRMEAGGANLTIKTLCRAAVAVESTWEAIASGPSLPTPRTKSRSARR